MDDEQESTPFLIIVRFDKDSDIRSRVIQSGPLVTAAIKELGPFQTVSVSYDGSMVAFMVSSALSAEQIYRHLQAPRSGRGSGLGMVDEVAVLPLDRGWVVNMSKVRDWLGKHAV